MLIWAASAAVLLVSVANFGKAQRIGFKPTGLHSNEAPETGARSSDVDLPLHRAKRADNFNGKLWSVDAYLNQGNCLVSYPLKLNKFCMETNGNAVIYTTNGNQTWSIWSTNTAGQGKPPYRMILWGYAKLTLEDGVKNTLWTSNTWIGNGGDQVHLDMQDGGNLVIYNGDTQAVWESSTRGCVPAPSVPTATATTSTNVPSYIVDGKLWSVDAYLNQGSCLPSPSKNHQLCMETNGNAVIHATNGIQTWPVWSTNTAGKGTGPYRLILWGYAKLTLEDGLKKTLWSNNIWIGNGGLSVHLDLLDNGVLAIYNGNTYVWNALSCGYFPVKSSLFVNETLNQGFCLTSSNRVNSLCMETSGNLVLYTTDGVKKWSLWATNTTGNGTAPYRLVNQMDGDVAVIDSRNSALWSFGGDLGEDQGSIRLDVQDNGDLVTMYIVPKRYQEAYGFPPESMWGHTNTRGYGAPPIVPAEE